MKLHLDYHCLKGPLMLQITAIPIPQIEPSAPPAKNHLVSMFNVTEHFPDSVCVPVTVSFVTSDIFAHVYIRHEHFFRFFISNVSYLPQPCFQLPAIVCCYCCKRKMKKRDLDQQPCEPDLVNCGGEHLGNDSNVL